MVKASGALTFKEKEKSALATVKILAEEQGWKYKGGGIYKVDGDFFHDAVFILSRKEDKLRMAAGIKPLAADDAFWDIIGAPANKKKPPGFRADAAFCVQPYGILEEKVPIQDFGSPRKDLEKPFHAAIKAVSGFGLKLKDAEGFAAYLAENPARKHGNLVALLSTLVALGKRSGAAALIPEARAHKVRSGFGFEGGKDFFDLAAEYLART